jgi:hypothetical protein
MFGRSKKANSETATKTVEPDGVMDAKAYVLWRYRLAIDYYWAASKSNKKAYKQSRRLVVIFGAVLTLVASLASASFVADRSWLDTTFSIATPMLAASLAIITGLTQNFQWGSAWRGMVLAAQALQTQEDRIKLLKPAEANAIEEIEMLNTTVLGETQQFFERVTGAVTLREEPHEEKSISAEDLQ